MALLSPFSACLMMIRVPSQVKTRCFTDPSVSDADTMMCSHLVFVLLSWRKSEAASHFGLLEFEVRNEPPSPLGPRIGEMVMEQVQRQSTAT